MCSITASRGGARGGREGASAPPHLPIFFFFTPCDFFFLISLLPTLNHSLRGKFFFRITVIYDSSHLTQRFIAFFRIRSLRCNMFRRKNQGWRRWTVHLIAKRSVACGRVCKTKVLIQNESFHLILKRSVATCVWKSCISSNDQLLFFVFYY